MTADRTKHSMAETRPAGRKIRLVHLTYDMRIGGTESVIKNLVEGIDTTVFEPEILCIQPNLGPFGEQMKARGIRVTNLHWEGGFDLRLIRQIRQYVQSNRVDILHCHQYTPWVYGTLAAAFTATKVIFTEHGRFYPDRTSWKRKLVNPVLLRFTHAVTAISQATRKALEDYEYIPQARVQVIYNGIKPLEADPQAVANLRRHLGIGDDTRVLGTVARMDPIKNQKMMLNAFARVAEHQPDTILLLVGDGEERQTLGQLARHLGLESRVRFTGYVAEPVHHIALMDIFLLSSLSEGTSMTLLEAMSLGKPCVVTDAGGNPEIIVDGENGWVTPNGEATPFADAILKLLRDEAMRGRMGASAKTRFDNIFHERQMNGEFMAMYQRLAAGDASPPGEGTRHAH